jgi:hypothetical protein
MLKTKDRHDTASDWQCQAVNENLRQFSCRADATAIFAGSGAIDAGREFGALGRDRLGPPTHATQIAQQVRSEVA